MDLDLFNHSFSFTVFEVSPLDPDACEFGLNKESPDGVSIFIGNIC